MNYVIQLFLAGTSDAHDSKGKTSSVDSESSDKSLEEKSG